MKQHILRAYLQCNLWLHASFTEDISRDSRQHEYSLNEENDLGPLIINDTLIPADLASPCNCLKYARQQGYPCRINQTACSQYCKCNAKQSCKNTSNCWWIIKQDQFISDISCWYFICIFIWGKYKNSFLSDFKSEFFFPDGKKIKDSLHCLNRVPLFKRSSNCNNSKTTDFQTKVYLWILIRLSFEWYIKHHFLTPSKFSWPWSLWRHISKWQTTDHKSESATYFFKILRHLLNNIRSQTALRLICTWEVTQLLQ